MNLKEAIKECKELWKEIEESGKTKYGFLNSPDGARWLAKHYWGSCPLCEYANPACSDCPLVIQYGKLCIELGFRDCGESSPEWFKAVRELKEK